MLFAAVCAIVAMSVMAGGSTAATTTHKWKFDPTINAPWAMEGDNEELDAPDAAAGLCRSTPFNAPTGAYSPLAATEVDAIHGDATNNSGFSNFGCTTPQNETTIAVNPQNANNLVAGANDYRVCCDFTGLNDGTGWAYYSFDGGKNWGNVQLPGLTAETGATGNMKKFDAAGDPALSFSPDGVVYYANIVFSRVSFASAVVVSSSRDGGQTWSDPSLLAYVDAGNFFNDKEWIAAGANGKVAVTWTRFNLGPQGAGYRRSPIVIATSKDYGKSWNSQGSPVSDDAHPFNQGSQVQYGNDGALYVSYEATSPLFGYTTDAMAIARSTDDGVTFQTKELARVYDDSDCYPIYAGRQTLTNMHFRLNSYPSMSVDPVTGEISIAWTDQQGSGTCGTGKSSFTGTTSNQVKLIHAPWATIQSAAVTRVTTSAEDKVFPSVASRGGKMVVSYYTRDYGITSTATVCNLQTNPVASGITPVATARSVCMDYAAKSSSDGFASQRRLSSESSNPFVQFADGSFIGDYSQIAMGSNGKAHAAWTDFRGNPGHTPANQDVLIANFTP
ncbi:MAG: hypothetical protein QOF27_610 [Gaiellaceae bacterium]|nr:hypothetical protein [Gaiellaceae bacterium]